MPIAECLSRFARVQTLMKKASDCGSAIEVVQLALHLPPIHTERLAKVHLRMTRTRAPSGTKTSSLVRRFFTRS